MKEKKTTGSSTEAKVEVAEIRVGALLYTLSASRITFTAIDSNRGREIYSPQRASNIVLKLEALKGELEDGMAVACGNVPRLWEFIENWGKELLPPLSWIESHDVVVIVPQGILHDIPFHLVLYDNKPLGTIVGITYASSMSLMARCMSRNPVRKRDFGCGIVSEHSRKRSAKKSRTGIVGGVDVLGHKNDVFVEISKRIGKYIGEDVFDLNSDESGGCSQVNRNSLKTTFRVPEKADILCIIAHGFIDPDSQRMSGLLVAKDLWGIGMRNIPLHGGRYFDFRDLPLRDFPDGLKPTMDAEVLTSAELEIDGELKSELVALIGCSTTTSRILPGDEPASMAEIFLRIGACSVIASVWDIDPDFIKEWSSLFFNEWLVRGTPKAIAYRQTMTILCTHIWRTQPERLGCMVLKGDWL